MSIAPTLQRYLDQKVTYDVLTHEPTMSSTRTAQVCRISGDRLAKGIVLRRNSGYMLAVLPASHHIRLDDLRHAIGDDIGLAREEEIDQLFRDCAHGAVPPVGECYGLEVVVDDAIEQQPDVYLEAGDHMTLIHLDRDQFAHLMAEARHAHFSQRIGATPPM
jgi:Ala-tRNA(Pro) deacylase